MKPTRPYRIKAVLFDLDGTLTQPGALDFSIIRKKLGCPADMPVLEFIEMIKETEAKEKAIWAFDEFEMNGARNSLPNPEAESLVRYIQSQNLRTAIIAHEFEDQLRASGLLQDEIDTCKQFVNKLSILSEAEIAGNHKGVTAMHDVTEGGLATALEELSVAGGHKIRAEMDMIPVFPETVKVCSAFNIKPIGLIGSGSLLICCSKDSSTGLIEKLTAADINVACIGEVLEKGRGVIAFINGEPAEWPLFEVDEITHLY